MSRDDDDLSDLLGEDHEEPETTTPDPHVPALVGKPRRGAGGRQLFLRSRGRVIGKKNSPERLKRLIKAISEIPVMSDACTMCGVSVSGVKYWLRKSVEGVEGDGFDVTLDDGNTVRFHEAWDDAMQMGVERVEVAMFNKALGQLEPQVFQGRVIYQLDPELLELGLTGPDAYLRDPKTKAPIPESVIKQDPDLMMFILKARKPEVYGNKQQVDITHRGGVLVVGAVAKTSEDLNILEAEYRQNGRPAVTFEDEDDNT